MTLRLRSKFHFSTTKYRSIKLKFYFIMLWSHKKRKNFAPKNSVWKKRKNAAFTICVCSRFFDAGVTKLCCSKQENRCSKQEKVVQRHFWLKRDEICEQIEGWIEETQSYITNKVSSSKTLPAYLAGSKSSTSCWRKNSQTCSVQRGLCLTILFPPDFLCQTYPIPVN